MQFTLNQVWGLVLRKNVAATVSLLALLSGVALADDANQQSKGPQLPLAVRNIPANTIQVSVANYLNAGQVNSAITNPGHSFNVVGTANELTPQLSALGSDPSVSAITISNQGNLSLSVARILAANSAFGKIANNGFGISVYDSAANVSQNLDALAAERHIGSVYLSDTTPGALSISSSQFMSDISLLAKFAHSNYEISLNDATAPVLTFTSAEFSKYFAVFSAISGSNYSLVLSDAGPETIGLTATEAIKSQNILSRIQNPSVKINVNDSAANIAANLDALNGFAHLNSITMNEFNGNPQLSLTASQLVNDPTALRKITNSTYSIVLSDGRSPALTMSAAQVLAEIGIVSRITTPFALTLSDSQTPTLSMSLSQFSDAEILFTHFTNTNYALMLSGTAAQISKTIKALNSNVHVASIMLTDIGPATLHVSADQVIKDSAVFNKISNTGVKIAVTDYAAAVTSDFDALAANSAITSITLKGDNTIYLTAAQIAKDSRALAMITNSGIKIVVSDTVANVSANFDAINSTAQISSMILLDSVGAHLALSAAQFLGDKHAMAALGGQNVTIDITDTAANISANIDKLVGVINLASITLTDTASPTIRLTSIQKIQDAAVLNLISGPYTLVILD